MENYTIRAVSQKLGGQPGHTGHSRKKQVVGIEMSVIVKEHHADVYYNSKTGEHLRVEFLVETTHDVNYDDSIKAFLYLLNRNCRLLLYIQIVYLPLIQADA